jgi:hypothetical protein
MYSIVHSPLKIREKGVTASLQIVYLVNGPAILISIMYQPLILNNHYLVQPDMINNVFPQNIQFMQSWTITSCFTLSCTTCHVKRYFVMYALNAPTALIHYVMIFSLSSCTIMQCFIRSCTYYPAMNSIVHHPAMIILTYTFPQCHATSCKAPFCHALSCKAPFLSCTTFSCATLPRS